MTNVNVQSLKPGDIVRLTWRDHYRMHDRKPTGKASVAESFGRVIAVTDDGVALFQNRVLNFAEVDAEECMDGQFILSCDIESVEVLTFTCQQCNEKQVLKQLPACGHVVCQDCLVDQGGECPLC